MHLSGYVNAPTEPAFIVLRHGMESIMYHLHEYIIYPRKNNFKSNESLYQYFFKAVSSEINKTQEYSNFLHTYCDADHARDLSDRLSFNSTYNLFNGTIIYCFSIETIKDT